MKLLIIQRILFGILLLSTQTVSSQIPIVQHDNYLGFSVGVESDQSPVLFHSLEFAFAPKHKVYFLGLGYYCLLKDKTEQGNYLQKKGEFHDQTTIFSIYGSQRFHFIEKNKIAPYIGLDLGIKSFSQQYDFEYKKTAIFIILPIDVKYTTPIFTSSQQSLTTALVVGLKFYTRGKGAITTEMQIRMAKAFNSYQGERNAVVASFSIGLQVGRRYNISSPKRKAQNSNFQPLF